MNDDLKQHVLSSGVNTGLISVLITLSSWIGGSKFATNYIFSILSFVLIICITYYYTKKYKNYKNGYLSFKEAFTLSTGILVCSGFINLFFSIILYNFIDPNFSIELTNEIIDKTVNQLESILPEDEIENLINEIEKSSSFTPINMIKGYIYSIIFYSVVGLIMGTILKKNKL